MTTSTTARPIDAEDLDFDSLTSFDSVHVAGSKLQPGFLLVDPDLGTPVYTLDHRLPADNAGGGRWLVYDHDARTWIPTRLPNARTFPVATGIAA